MDIYAKPGTKVVFANPNCGYPHDQEQAAKWLEVGETYTLASTKIGGFHTDVSLKEVSGHTFNSVMFDDQEPPHD